jgi:hypothetical protein
LIILLIVFLTVGLFANDHDGWGIGTGFYGGIHGQQTEPYFAVTLSGDYHFLERDFPKNEKFGWFLGSCIVFSHSHYDGKIAFAGRIPFGIYFVTIKFFDFFLEFAPEAGLYTFSAFSTIDPILECPACWVSAIGFRSYN